MGMSQWSRELLGLLADVAGERSVEVYFTESRVDGELLIGLRRGEVLGEFQISGMTMEGSLSLGYEYLLLEYDDDELVRMAVEIVALAAEGLLTETQVRFLWKKRRILASPEGYLPVYGRRILSGSWWHPGGPYAKTFLM